MPVKMKCRECHKDTVVLYPENVNTPHNVVCVECANDLSEAADSHHYQGQVHNK